MFPARDIQEYKAFHTPRQQSVTGIEPAIFGLEWLASGEYGRKNIYEGANLLVCQFLISHITKLHITKLYLSIPKPSLCFFGLRPKKQGMVKINYSVILRDIDLKFWLPTSFLTRNTMVKSENCYLLYF